MTEIVTAARAGMASCHACGHVQKLARPSPASPGSHDRPEHLSLIHI